MRRLDSVSIPI